MYYPEGRRDPQFVDGLDQDADIVTQHLADRFVDLPGLANGQPSTTAAAGRSVPLRLAGDTPPASCNSSAPAAFDNNRSLEYASDTDRFPAGAPN